MGAVVERGAMHPGQGGAEERVQRVQSAPTRRWKRMMGRRATEGQVGVSLLSVKLTGGKVMLG